MARDAGPRREEPCRSVPGRPRGPQLVNPGMRKLTVEDILDSRAYERERDAIRGQVIGLKRTRRVALGPIMSMVFENTETMRWQVQEMARAERMLRDEQIAHEVDMYNQLIPDVGELSATLLL